MKSKKSFPKLDFSFMAPYPLQQEILDCTSRFLIVAFGRQSGKSWLAKRYLLDEAGNKGKRCWWVAPTLPTAQDHWLDLLDLLEDSGIPVKAINKSTKTIRFLSGGSIRIRSADIPDNLRGGTLDVLVLDEAAFMVEDVWYRILQPTITASRGKVMFLSSANGQNWFYRLFLLGKNDKFPDFKSWKMPSTDAPYQDHEMLEVIRQTVPDLVWREEYLCEFLADSGGVFTGLDKLPYQPMLFKPIKGHEYIAGIDWGMDGDFSIFTIGDKYERRQVFGVRFTAVDPVEQVTRFIELLDLWQPSIAYIETNGIGKPMYKMLKSRFVDRNTESDDEDDYKTLGVRGRTKLRGVHVNNERKRKLVEDYAGAISWGRFVPLVRENEMDTLSFGAIQMSEMSTFLRKHTASGLEVTYGAAEGYHDDCVSGGYLLYKGMTYDPDDDKPDVNEVAHTVHKTSKKSPFQSRRTHVGRENTRRNLRRAG